MSLALPKKARPLAGLFPNATAPESFRHVAVESLAQRPLIRGSSVSNPTHKDSLFKSILVAELSKRLVPPHKAARHLHLTLSQFETVLPRLIQRGFPRPCPVLGYFDLTAIGQWLDRQSGIGSDLLEPAAEELEEVILARLEEYRRTLTRDPTCRSNEVRS